MPKVMVYYLHEDELDAAKTAIEDAEVTEGFVFGELDEGGIEALRESNIVVHVIEDDEDEDEWVPRLRQARSALGIADAEVAEPDRFEIEPGTPICYIVTLAGPLLDHYVASLRDTGAELVESLGPRRYSVFLTPQQLQAVRSHEYVEAVRPFNRAAVEPETDLAATGDSVSDSGRLITFDIRLHRGGDLQAVLDRLSDAGVPVEAAAGRRIRTMLRPESGLDAQIRGMPEVYDVQEHVERELHNDHARALLGMAGTTANPVGGAVRTGSGQIVAVADTGIDEQHPDLAGRIAGVVALGRQGDPSDPNGHGTHVAGSIVGDGSASGGAIVGIAPEATVFFQSVMDRRGKLGGLPLDLGTLFEEAHNVGARIHNNSWGAATAARYTVDSIDVDEFVSGRPDMLLVFSAGNEGSSRSPTQVDAGEVDWLSMGSPATSKNVLTVGASRSDRTEGGFSKLTHAQAWPGDFPNDPMASETVSGDPESIAGFSSRGPCNDRRVKPDVVAPGSDILSTRSSTAPLRNFWGNAAAHGGHYAFMGGTSMSAPLVSGCAALMRQYYVDERSHDPSAALLKATLVNGTRKLSGRASVAQHPEVPNYHQGFGCVHMPTTLPGQQGDTFVLKFIDGGADGLLQRLGAASRFQVGVAEGREFRICLTWTDVPGRGLQNNLNLIVDRQTDRTKWIGNQNRHSIFRGQPDVDNNVEIVRIDDPTAAFYTIKVVAANLLRPPQAFALVVTGNLTTDLLPF